MPASSQRRVIQNNIDNSGPVDWWVRVHWPGNSLHPRSDLDLLRLISADNGDAADSLTVESEVLRERLREHHSVGVGREQS